MRFPGLKTARYASLWIKNRINPGAVILGYHRIANVEADSFYNSLSPKNFAGQMEVLKRYANPVSLENMVKMLAAGSLPPRTVCVTIDDGYADALVHAKPILEKFEVPAEVFITAGNLGGEFWWDEVERYVINVPAEADPLHLVFNHREYAWDFKQADAKYRTGAAAEIADVLRPLNEANRRLLLDEIKDWARPFSLPAQPLARSLTAEEITLLSDGGLIQIGSHTMTHPMLPILSEQEKWYELHESKSILEKILRNPVASFSYPNGAYSPDDPWLVAKAGYAFACKSRSGTVHSHENLFTLPRFWIKDIDGSAFHWWLQRWS
jgi:peptidoglycan/xylan/chitin deacetylase (PgdA/CDA1 family)